ncbi:MAG: nucleotidyl transferase AbiEii/AbiGii toxin family protein [Thermoplasmata archaeon]
MRWNDIEFKAERQGVSPKLILREEVQKGILTSFSKEGLFQTLVFQGGTALRLFYDNPRFSEDLDFVLREKKNMFRLRKYLEKTEDFIVNSFPFLDTVQIRAQKVEDDFQRLMVNTISDSPEQRVRVNVEVFDVPSYENEIKILSFSPINPAVRVETAKEILADKVTALSGRDYIKGRDLWDIYLLWEQRSVDLDLPMVIKKIEDYGEKSSEFTKNLEQAGKRLEKEGTKILERELKRFLSPSLYQNYDEDLDAILDAVRKLIEEVIQNSPSFEVDK